MIISHDKNAKSNFEVTINKVPISNCNSYKYLGIIFGDDLKWKTHLEHVSQKMSQATGIIAKLRNHVSGRHSKLVYSCFAKCYLQYGVLCWGNSNKTIIESLQKQQNKILKLMSRIKWNDYVKLDQVYHTEKMLKVSDITRLELAKFIYRYHKFKVLIYSLQKIISLHLMKSTRIILEVAHPSVIFSLLLTLQQADVHYCSVAQNVGMQFRLI